MYNLVKGGDGLLRIVEGQTSGGTAKTSTINQNKTKNKGDLHMENSSFLAPSNQQEATGLIDNVDVTFNEVRVVLWDYNGKVPNLTPALQVTMGLDDDSVQVQYYSLGKATDWQPNEDGTQIVAVGKATGIATNSNAALLINSLVNAGFPENKVTDDVRFLEGLKVHMARVPAPKRGGAPKPPREDGRVFEDTVLVAESIISFPWDKKSTTPKGKPATAGTTAGKPATAKTTAPAAAAQTEAGGDDDIDSRCQAFMLEILAENGNSIAKNQIPGLMLKKAAKDPDKNTMVSRAFQDAFLSAGPWEFQNGKVTLG